MPSPVRFLVTFLIALGVGSLTWGFGGLVQWDAPLIQNEPWTYMDAKGAIGIGVGALAGAITAIVLFRERSMSSGWNKPAKGPMDLSRPRRRFEGQSRTLTSAPYRSGGHVRASRCETRFRKTEPTIGITRLAAEPCHRRWAA
jgi:hypothetical protein